MISVFCVFRAHRLQALQQQRTSCKDIITQAIVTAACTYSYDYKASCIMHLSPPLYIGLDQREAQLNHELLFNHA